MYWKEKHKNVKLTQLSKHGEVSFLLGINAVELAVLIYHCKIIMIQILN